MAADVSTGTFQSVLKHYSVVKGTRAACGAREVHLQHLEHSRHKMLISLSLKSHIDRLAHSLDTIVILRLGEFLFYLFFTVARCCY